MPPATHTSCVVIGDETLFVVDAAPTDASQRALLQRHLQERLARGATIGGFILTHLHPDHIGAAAPLARHFQAPILATERTASDLRAGTSSSISSGEASLDELPVVDRFLEEGDRLAGWEVLETPGHAHRHLCLWRADERVLIAGDLCAGVGTILIEPGQGDMTQYLHSLRRMADLEPDQIIPSHGPILKGTAPLRALIEHRLRRERRVLEALNIQARTLQALTARAYADTPKELWSLAELSLESHLLKLLEEGRAVRCAKGWSSPRP